MLSASHSHSLTITKDSSPANASATTNIIDPNDDKLYCLCGNINFGEMIGCDGPDCETGWFHFACVGIDPKAKPEAAGFARVAAWERTQVLGRRLVVVVPRAVDVIGVGGVVGRRARVVGRGDTGGFEQRNWYRIYFKVS